MDVYQDSMHEFVHLSLFTHDMKATYIAMRLFLYLCVKFERPGNYCTKFHYKSTIRSFILHKVHRSGLTQGYVFLKNFANANVFSCFVLHTM